MKIYYARRFCCIFYHQAAAMSNYFTKLLDLKSIFQQTTRHGATRTELFHQLGLTYRSNDGVLASE